MKKLLRILFAIGFGLGLAILLSLVNARSEIDSFQTKPTAISEFIVSYAPATSLAAPGLWYKKRASDNPVALVNLGVSVEPVLLEWLTSDRWRPPP